MSAGTHPLSASLTAANGPKPISRAARKKFSQSSACRLSACGNGPRGLNDTPLDDLDSGIGDQYVNAAFLTTKAASSTCIRIGGGSQLRDFGRDIAVFYQLGITFGHLEGGFLPLTPETDVELVATDTEIVNGQIRQPFRKRRVDIQLVARRIGQKAQ